MNGPKAYDKLMGQTRISENLGNKNCNSTIKQYFKINNGAILSE